MDELDRIAENALLQACQMATERYVTALETENAELREQNEKLRELVLDMWHNLPKSESCEWDMNLNTCTSDGCIGECSYWYRMRDLGIETE